MTTVPALETLASLVEALAERGEEIAIVEADTGREVRAGELAAAVPRRRSVGGASCPAAPRSG